MSELRPYPLALLVRRLALEAERGGDLFDLPRRSCYAGFEGLDLSTEFHGARAATPVGPAAGPHTQMAQNLVLSFLAGARILELKTVQVNDRLQIGRPCIDIQTVGFNIEWSQELQVHQSLEEYAKAWLLIGILRLLDVPALQRRAEHDVVFDISLGYDLAGIQSRKLTRFVDTILNAKPLLDRLRRELARELPAPLRRLADAPLPDRIADCVTLSTFHGCPPEQIGSICRHLIDRFGVHVVVKLNPTLLGYREARELLCDRLGYSHLRIRESAFADDPSFDQAVDLLRELRGFGAARGRTVGAKFTNTLVVENDKGWLAGEPMYLSGEPLYVLALALAARFRRAIGAELPVSFSAGIDKHNIAAAVACGFTPITACTDLLRPGGYARLHGYLAALAQALREAGAQDRIGFILRQAGADPASASDPAAVAAASLQNHERAVAEALENPRYRHPATATPPRKIGSHLALFDCVNCDKCIPVCPNHANFFYSVPPCELSYRDLEVQDGELRPGPPQRFSLGGAKRSSHQIGNFADFCNDCGNCDVFCPEDGGPYIEKPRLFGSRAGFELDRAPGFYLEQSGDTVTLLGRTRDYRLELRMASDGSKLFSDGYAELTFIGDEAEPREAFVLRPAARGHRVPVGLYHAMRHLAQGLLSDERLNYVNLPYSEDPRGDAAA
ncbi:MAG TPA: glutamate synthase [Acidobacteriota bacterium]